MSATFLEHLSHHDGRQAQCGLVQQQHPRRRHEPAAQGQHLLLPSGHLAGQVAPLLVQDGEELHHRVHPPPLLRRVSQVKAAHLQVLLHGEVGEHPAPLGDEGDALLHDLVGGRLQRLLSPVDGPAHHRRQPHDGLEHGRLPGPVGAHHRHDLPLPHSKGHVLQGYHGPVVHGHAVHLQEPRPPTFIPRSAFSPRGSHGAKVSLHWNLDTPEPRHPGRPLSRPASPGPPRPLPRREGPRCPGRICGPKAP